MAFLRSSDGRDRIPLQANMTLIGRDPGSDVVISSNGVSRRHAMIVKSPDGHFLEDLDSSNGTFLNGTRIDRRTLLSDNDRIEIFDSTLTFHDAPDEVGDDRTADDDKTSADMAAIVSSLDSSMDLRLGINPETKLRAVLEITKRLSDTLELDVVLPRILECLFSVFRYADRGFVLLSDPATGKMVPKAIQQRNPSKSDSLPISWTVVNHAVSTGKAVLSADVGSDARFDPSVSIQALKIHSVLCAPMMSSSGKILGVIGLDSQDRRTAFTQDDLDLLVSVAYQASHAIELARLHQERRDLEAANRIQRSFLPNKRPQIANLEFFDYYAAAQHVGGDYYDYIQLPNDRLAIALGDVSGKGVSAALLMARLSSAVRFCLAANTDLAEAVRQLNRLLSQTQVTERFITFVVLVLDVNDMSFTIVNAGHMPPMRRRESTGQVENLGDEIIGLPLGVVDRPYEQLTVPLETGDSLILFTDGLSEARSSAGVIYGFERVIASYERAPQAAEGIISTILADVREFTSQQAPADDLTLVGIRRK